MSLILAPMGVKYYTHFIAQEQGAPGYDEYRGVVELRGVSGRISEDREVAQVLARSFDLQEDDIQVLQWTQLH
jgi:hypothetical protein